jgi:hypothetical protein
MENAMSTNVSHFNDPITSKDSGFGRRPGQATDAVKTIVFDRIVSIAQEYIAKPGAKLTNSGISNLLEYAYHESGFSPSAASDRSDSTASAVFQVASKSKGQILNFESFYFPHVFAHR